MSLIFKYWRFERFLTASPFHPNNLRQRQKRTDKLTPSLSTFLTKSLLQLRALMGTRLILMQNVPIIGWRCVPIPLLPPFKSCEKPLCGRHRFESYNDVCVWLYESQRSVSYFRERLINTILNLSFSSALDPRSKDTKYDRKLWHK